MSSLPPADSTPPPPPPPPSLPAPTGIAPPREIIIYGHSSLFYWWPVWVFGYLFAVLTWMGGHRAAILPEESVYESGNFSIKRNDQPGSPEKVAGGVITIMRSGQPTTLDTVASGVGENGRFRERMSTSSTYGIWYVFILLLVILITTVPLRGISSLVAIVTIALVIVSFSYLEWWEPILRFFGNLRIHMNMGFYVFLSTALLIIWAVVFFVYDRMNYWRVTPGQITHKYVFGGGERSFDTAGINFEKRRDDLFRHYILGFGSGDLVMDPLKAGGATKDDLSIFNVLFIGTKLRQIDELIAKQVDGRRMDL